MFMLLFYPKIHQAELTNVSPLSQTLSVKTALVASGATHLLNDMLESAGLKQTTRSET